MLICQGQAPRDKVSLFNGPDKSGQVETFLCLLSPSPPRHRSETGSGTSSHAPPFFITQSYRCLKPSCLATKCFFSTAPLFCPFTVSPAPPPSINTHSHTHKNPRNCIIERQLDHHKAHNNSHFVFLLLPSLCKRDYHLYRHYRLPISSCFSLFWSTPQANDRQACPCSNTC